MARARARSAANGVYSTRPERTLRGGSRSAYLALGRACERFGRSLPDASDARRAVDGARLDRLRHHGVEGRRRIVGRREAGGGRQRQRNSLSASAKLTTSHAPTIASEGATALHPAP